MRIWDLITGLAIYDVPIQESEPEGFTACYLLKKHEIVILGGHRGNLLLFHIPSKLIHMKSELLHEGIITHICSLQEKLILTGSWDKTMKVSNWHTGQVLQTIRIHNDWVTAIIIYNQSNGI